MTSSADAITLKEERMTRFARIAMSSHLIWLAGCATSSPVLTEDLYERSAFRIALSERCATGGMMDANTAAAGSSMVQEGVAQFAYDPVRLQKLTNDVSREMQNTPITQAHCNAWAYEIARGQQSRAQAQARAAADAAAVNAAAQSMQSIQQSLPKTTYCNRFGTQVTCNTY